MTLVACSGSDRRETATLLLAMAREKGMPTSVVRSVYNGYEVPQELLELDVEPPVVAVVVMDEAPKRRGRPAKETAPVDSQQASERKEV